MENQVQTQLPVSRNIFTEDEQDLSYWSNEFGIAKEELMEVVKRGGTFAEAVENYVKTLKFAL